LSNEIPLFAMIDFKKIGQSPCSAPSHDSESTHHLPLEDTSFADADTAWVLCLLTLTERQHGRSFSFCSDEHSSLNLHANF